MDRLTKAKLLELLEDRERALEQARSVINRALGYVDDDDDDDDDEIADDENE